MSEKEPNIGIGQCPESPRISGVICTYNRARFLHGALNSLCTQTLERSLYEIVVVDNASTDNTQEVVGSFEHHGNIHYCHERRPGLGNARNRGWREARGEYIAYMDDDAQAGEDWLETALTLFDSSNPKPLCMGGVILPFYTTSRPEWFKDEYEMRTWGKEPRHLHRGESLSGSNMIWQKEVIETYGGFATDRGVSGEYLSVGEEAALFARIWEELDQPCLYYSPRLVVYHWVDPFKMNVAYRLRRSLAEGYVQGRFSKPNSFKRRLRLLAGSLKCIVVGSGRALLRFSSHPSWQNSVYEDWHQVAGGVGTILGCAGLKIQIRQRK